MNIYEGETGKHHGKEQLDIATGKQQQERNNFKETANNEQL